VKKSRRTSKKAWRRARPRGAAWISPVLHARDPRRLAELYERAFGFTIERVHPAEGPAELVELRHRGRAVVMIGRSASVAVGREAPVTIQVYVPDVDLIVARAHTAGVTVVAAPEDAPWGDRVALLRDSEGHAWRFATHRRIHEKIT
jgi:uncharacterized glyoxalase superfamily protein PhnB